MRDYTNQFNMKLKKNQFGGKVVRQAINDCPFGTEMARPAQWAMGSATNERKYDSDRGHSELIGFCFHIFFNISR